MKILAVLIARMLVKWETEIDFWCLDREILFWKKICSNSFPWLRNVGLDRGPIETKSRNILSMYFFIAYLIHVTENKHQICPDMKQRVCHTRTKKKIFPHIIRHHIHHSY